MDNSPSRSVSRSGDKPRLSRNRSKVSGKGNSISHQPSQPALDMAPLTESNIHEYINAKAAQSLLSSTIKNTHNPVAANTQTLLITDAYVNISGHTPADPNSRGVDFSGLNRADRHKTAVMFMSKAKTVRRDVRMQHKVDVTLPEFTDSSILEEQDELLKVRDNGEYTYMNDMHRSVPLLAHDTPTLLIPGSRSTQSMEASSQNMWLLACGWNNEQEMLRDVFTVEDVSAEKKSILLQTMKDIARGVSKQSSDMHEQRAALLDGNLKSRIVHAIEKKLDKQNIHEVKNPNFGLLTSIVSPVPGIPAFSYKPSKAQYPILKHVELGVTSRLRKGLTKRLKTKKQKESVWQNNVLSVEEEKLMVSSLNGLVEFGEDEFQLEPYVLPEMGDMLPEETDLEAWQVEEVEQRVREIGGEKVKDQPEPTVVSNHMVWRSLLLPNEVAPSFSSKEVAEQREQVTEYKEKAEQEHSTSEPFARYVALLETDAAAHVDKHPQTSLHTVSTNLDTFTLPSQYLKMLAVRAPAVFDVTQGSLTPAVPALLYTPSTVPDRPVLNMFAPYLYSEGLDLRYHTNSMLTPALPQIDTDQEVVYARGCTSQTEFKQHDQYHMFHKITRSAKSSHPLCQLTKYAVLHYLPSNIQTTLDTVLTSGKVLDFPTTPQLPATLPYVYNQDGCSYQEYQNNLSQLSVPTNTMKKQSQGQSPQDALRDQVNMEKRSLWNTCYHPEGVVYYNPLSLLQYISMGGPEPVKSPLLLQQQLLQNAKAGKLPWGIIPSSVLEGEKETNITNNNTGVTIPVRKLTEVGSSNGCVLAPSTTFHKTKLHKQVKNVTNWLYGGHLDVDKNSSYDEEAEELKKLHALELLLSDKESAMTEIHLLPRDTVGSDDESSDPFVSYTRRFSAVYKVIPEQLDEYSTPVVSSSMVSQEGKLSNDKFLLDVVDEDPDLPEDEPLEATLQSADAHVHRHTDDEDIDIVDSIDDIARTTDDVQPTSILTGIIPPHLALHLSPDTMIHDNPSLSPQHFHTLSTNEQSDSSASQASMNQPILPSLHVDKSITVIRRTKGKSGVPTLLDVTTPTHSTTSVQTKDQPSSTRSNTNNTPRTPIYQKNIKKESIVLSGLRHKGQPTTQKSSKYWWEASADERELQIKGQSWSDRVNLVTKLLRQGQSIQAQKGRVAGRGYTGGGKGEKKIARKKQVNVPVDMQNSASSSNLESAISPMDVVFGDDTMTHTSEEEEEDRYADEDLDEEEDVLGYYKKHLESYPSQPILPSFEYGANTEAGEVMYQQSLVNKVEHIWKQCGLGVQEQAAWLERAKPRFLRTIWLWTQALTLFQLRAVLRGRIGEISRQLQDYKVMIVSKDLKRLALQTSKQCELYRACCQSMLQFLQLTSAVCIVCLAAETIYQEPLTINGILQTSLVKADYSIYKSAYDVIHDSDLQHILRHRKHVEKQPIGHEDGLHACDVMLRTKVGICALHPMVLPSLLQKCIPLKFWGITSGEDRVQVLMQGLFGHHSTSHTIHSLVDGQKSASESLKRQFPDSHYEDHALEHHIKGDEEGELDLFDFNNDIKMAVSYANMSQHADQGDYTEDLLGFFLRQTMEKQDHFHQVAYSPMDGTMTQDTETQQFILTSDVYSQYKGTSQKPIPFTIEREKTQGSHFPQLPPETARVDAMNAQTVMKQSQVVISSSQEHTRILSKLAQVTWQKQLQDQAIQFVLEQTRIEKIEEEQRVKWMSKISPEVFQYQDLWTSMLNTTGKKKSIVERMVSNKRNSNISNNTSTQKKTQSPSTSPRNMQHSTKSANAANTPLNTLPPVITPNLQPLALLTAERVATIMSKKTIPQTSTNTLPSKKLPISQSNVVVNPFSIKRTSTVKPERKELSITTMAAIQARIIGKNNKL